VVKGVIIGKPRTYPVFGGSLPSMKGGRRSVVLASVDPDGNYTIEKEDAGAEGSSGPILFVPFGGIDYPMNKEDLKEMMAGMRERHNEWRERQAPVPDMTKRLKDFCEIIVNHAKGRKQFYMGGK
jgi:hypothetical protein